MGMFEKAVTDAEQHLNKYFSIATGPSFNPETIPARRRFLARRVKLLANLLRWRKSMGNHHGDGLLVTRIVNGCVLKAAESGWDVGGEDIVKKVCI